MAGNPTQQYVDQARRDLSYIARFLPSTLETVTLLAEPLTGTDYDRAGGKGGIADPTPGQVDRHGEWIKLRADIISIPAQIATLTAMLVQAMNRVPVTESEQRARETECSGGLDRVDYEGWEQRCHGNWLRRTGENAFLCQACIRRKDRHREDKYRLSIA